MNEHFWHVKYFSSISLTLVTDGLPKYTKLTISEYHVYYSFPNIAFFNLTHFLNLNLVKGEFILLLQMGNQYRIPGQK